MFSRFKILSLIAFGIFCMGINQAKSEEPTCSFLVDQCISEKSCDSWKISPYTKEDSLAYRECLQVANWYPNDWKTICHTTCHRSPWDAACLNACPI